MELDKEHGVSQMSHLIDTTLLKMIFSSLHSPPNRSKDGYTKRIGSKKTRYITILRNLQPRLSAKYEASQI